MDFGSPAWPGRGVSGMRPEDPSSGAQTSFLLWALPPRGRAPAPCARAAAIAAAEGVCGCLEKGM